MQALLLLDLQNDYGAFGGHPVAESEQLVPLANQLMERFEMVVATQNWFPADHLRFAANHPWRHPGQTIEINGLQQELSIIHCVQNSFGAELMGGLQTPKIKDTFYKGIDAKWDSHSAFYDKNRSRETGLHAFLQANNIDALYILGLDVANSVQSTALDALGLAYKTIIIKDRIKSFQSATYGGAGMSEKLQAEGVIFKNADELT